MHFSTAAMSYPFSTTFWLSLYNLHKLNVVISISNSHVDRIYYQNIYIYIIYINYLCIYKDIIYIDMQAGINLEVLGKCANSAISVLRMAFYPLDCC